MCYQPAQVLRVLEAVTSAHRVSEPPLYPFNIVFMIANITWMEKKKKKKGRGLGSASKFNWNSNWLTKAGNHVPYENESIWCMRVCACLFSLPAEARGASMGNMCPGCQKEALLSCKINRRWGLPMLITAMFYFSLTQKVQEAQVWELHLACSLPTWKKSGVFPLLILSESLEVDTQETVFPLQISTKMSCYCNKPLDSAAPLHRLVYK